MDGMDSKCCAFLSKPRIFADAMNGVVYRGRKVICEEQLLEVQNAYHVLLHGRNREKRRKMRKRDVVKAIRRNGHFVILAVELQGMAHYFMPLRCTEYDLYDLLRQREDQAKQYLKNGETKRAEEYLSRGTPEDKLRPVMTFVLHLGSE